MKKRIGNDIQFTWHIYRKSGDTQTPESFDGKDVEVKLISPLQRPVTIEDVTIATGVVTFTFRGKHQVTLGNYVAVLQENTGENGMVTLDVVSAVTLVPHSYMEEDDDEGDVIEATSVELTSEITAGGGGGIEQQQADWAQTDDTAVDYIKNKPNLNLYCRKDADNTHSDSVDIYVKRVYHEQGALIQLDRLTVGGDSIKFYHSHRGEETKELSLQLDDVEKIKRTATTELDGLMSAADKGKLNDLPTNSELATLLNGKANTADLANKENWDYAGDEFLVTERKTFNDIVVPKADVNPPGTYVLEGVEKGKVTMRLFCYNGMMTKKNVVISNVHNGVTTVLYTYEVGYYETLEEILTLPVETGTLVFENYVINNIWQVKNIVNDYYVSRRSLSDYARLADLAPVATSGSYNDLSDKPDLSGFITNSVDNLVNYYLKSETYTKNEVLQLIGALQMFHYEIYPERPQSGAGNVLYLIGPTGSGSDKYEEYVYANNDWTKIGDTSIDLSGYVTTQALNTALADYVTSSALSTALANYYNKTEVDGLLAGKANQSEMSVVQGTGADADKTTITLKQGTSATVLTTHQDISGKEDVTTIATPVDATDATLPITTLTCEEGKYYRIDVAVDTLAITLPAITDLAKVKTIVIYLTSGTTPAITISSADSKDVYYQDGFEIEAGNTYEINALFNGAAWIVASVKINVE